MLSESEINEIKEIGILDKKMFPINISAHKNYYTAIAKEANIDLVMPVIFKICEQTLHNAFCKASIYRSVKLRIIDDEN